MERHGEDCFLTSGTKELRIVKAAQSKPVISTLDSKRNIHSDACLAAGAKLLFLPRRTPTN